VIRAFGIFLLLLLIDCQQSNHRSQKLEFDSTRIAIFALDTTTVNEEKNVELSYLKNNGSAISLYQNDLVLIEVKLEECIVAINKEQKRVFEKYGKDYPYEKLTIKEFLVTLARYNRQYVPYMSKEGERHVWVNCFCSKSREEGNYWRSNIIDGLGGGSCYFSVTINLSKGTYQGLWVNAPM
jgi:hypothetical protein